MLVVTCIVLFDTVTFCCVGLVSGLAELSKGADCEIDMLWVAKFDDVALGPTASVELDCTELARGLLEFTDTGVAVLDDDPFRAVADCSTDDLERELGLETVEVSEIRMVKLDEV